VTDLEKREAFAAGAEHAAMLVEAMMDMTPWKDKMDVRCALAIAATAIRRGRHLTDKEKLDNLLRTVFEAKAETAALPHKEG
jgi:hypothetical protein